MVRETSHRVDHTDPHNGTSCFCSVGVDVTAALPPLVLVSIAAANEAAAAAAAAAARGGVATRVCGHSRSCVHHKDKIYVHVHVYMHIN